jgi:hypothetical protein
LYSTMPIRPANLQHCYMQVSPESAHLPTL